MTRIYPGAQSGDERCLLTLALLFVTNGPVVLAKGPGSDQSNSSVNATGYDRDSAYFKIDGPEINAFNLNFVVQFPLAIGLSYPENAGLSLQLDLTYSSRVSYNQRRGVGALTRRFGRIRRQNPFGLGFDLSLGKIIYHANTDTVASPSATLHPRLDYVDASGAKHGLSFFATTPLGDEWRTHDGTHLRALWSNGSWVLNFPDGIVQELHHYIGALAHAPDNSGRTDLAFGDSRDTCDVYECGSHFFVSDPIGDRNGTDWSGFDRDYVGWHVSKVYSIAALPGTSSYTVEYFGDDNDPVYVPFAHVIRYIRDQHGRTIEFVLNPVDGTVSDIKTPAPGTLSGARPPADYHLEYRTVTVSEDIVQGYQVKALATVRTPNLLSDGTAYYIHRFGYATGGQINRIDYPSGKAVKLSYVKYPFLNGSRGYCMGTGSTPPDSDEDECNAATNGGTCAPTWGVSQVDTYLNGDTGNDSPLNHLVTTFTQRTLQRDFQYFGATDCPGYDLPDNNAGYYRYDQINTMVDAAGNKTEFRYRTPKEDGAQSKYGTLVSEKYFGGSGSSAELLKEVDYTYALLDSYWWVTNKDGDFEMVPDSLRTTWPDDVTLGYVLALNEDRSDFDNFGHYQRTVFTGNSVGPTAKVLIKDYAADNPGTACDTLRDNWLGEVVVRDEVSNNSGAGDVPVSRTVYGFDAQRGLRTRAIDRFDLTGSASVCDPNPAPATNDVATDYHFYASSGDLEWEKQYLTGAPAGSDPDSVTTTYTYQYGSQQSIQRNGLSYYDHYRTIDRDSGLILQDRVYATSPTDTTAETTQFDYDILGRATTVTHATDDPLTMSYENDPEAVSAHDPPPVEGAVRLARVRSSRGTGALRVESVDHFSSARFDHEEKLNPDSSRAYRYVSYDSSGRKSFVSEWTRQSTSSGVPGTSIEYGVYDGSTYLYEEPFGRLTKRTDSLGGVTAYRYFGTSKEVTSERVALKSATLENPADIQTTYLTDGLGRLRFVSKPSVVNGIGPYETTGTAAKYTYDVLGRLLRVDLSPGAYSDPADDNTDRFHVTLPDAATQRQTRTYTYDNVGHLTSAMTPESGTTLNQQFNAMGNITQYQDSIAAALGYALRTTFDTAGRPIREEKIADAGQIMSLSYTPDSSEWAFSSDWRVDSPGNCLKDANLQPVESWYIGDTACSFSQGAGGVSGATLTSPTLTSTAGAILAFRYFRQVHADSAGVDTLRVQVRDTAVTPESWQTIYKIDSTEISWSRWMWSPPLSITPPVGSLQIRFVFDAPHSADNTLRGIGIARVVIRQPSSTTLKETIYDQGPNGRGRPFKMVEYDEATLAPIFTRQLNYYSATGRLSDETLTLDWDRDGIDSVLVDQYAYDSQGNLQSQWMPHAQGSSTRRYDYSRSHGAIVDVAAVDPNNGAIQHFTSTAYGAGIEYNDAGTVSVVRYGNGTTLSVSSNVAYLPQRYLLTSSDDTSLYDTGTYAYDGAKNVKQIGDDYYRYDADSRLTWSRVSSYQHGTVDLDQQYDPYGNMTAQLASSPGGGTPSVPQGLAFSGRSFVDASGNKNNRMSAGAAYDPAGRMTLEVAHDGLPTQEYEYGSDGHLAAVTDGLGRRFQSALYEGDGHRWYRSVSAEGSAALITLRDASGQVVSDFSEMDGSGLKLQREYVRVDGQLLAINSTCGPRPALALSDPPTVGSQVWFDKNDFNVTPAGDYTIRIRTATGQTKTITKPASLANHFSIAQAEFFPGVTNWIQIETEAACGRTGYSNSVSYGYVSGNPPGACLTSLGGHRSGVTFIGSTFKVIAAGYCAAGTQYNVWYYNDSCECATRLNGTQPTTTPSKTLSNLPCSSGMGEYWIATVDPVTHHELYASPHVLVDGSSCSAPGVGDDGVTLAAQGQPSMNAQYVAWDHLGSTRAVTDEQGVVVAGFKYYPFGLEAETAGGNEIRQKFTGHERDDRVGLDYMMARNCRMPLARFLEPDSFGGSNDLAEPQSWNRYTYAMNAPTQVADPSGYAGELVRALCAITNSCESPLLGGPIDFVTAEGTSGAIPSIHRVDAVPSEVKAAAKASVQASNAPSQAAGDTKGGFHEEGGFWGRDATGKLVVVPAEPGKVATPGVDTKAQVDVMKAADPDLAKTVVSVEGTWHVHPRGKTWVMGRRWKFPQEPSSDDSAAARSGINFVVGARWKKIFFFDSSGKIGKSVSFSKFFKH